MNIVFFDFENKHYGDIVHAFCFLQHLKILMESRLSELSLEGNCLFGLLIIIEL